MHHVRFAKRETPPDAFGSIDGASLELATFRRKIDVSGIEVSWLPQNKTRRGERRARVGLD